MLNGTPGQAKWEVITPKQASEYLNLNTRNRPLNDGRVAALVADINAGRWVDNAGAVIVLARNADANWTLADGQHRLAAIVQSGKSAKMMVAWSDVPLEQVQRVIDTGRARSLTDYAHLEGVANASNVSGIAKWACAWDRGLRAQAASNRISRQEVIDYLISHMDELQTATRRASLARRSVRVPHAALGMAALLFARLSDDKCAEFIQHLSEGASLERGDPILAFRNRLLSVKGNLGRYDALGLLITAWNAWVRGETRFRFEIPTYIGLYGETVQGFGSKNFPEPLAPRLKK